MKHLLRICYLLAALAAADYVCTAANNALRVQFLADLETSTGWLRGYARLESFELLTYGIVFAVLGYATSRLIRSRTSALLIAATLGLAYSLVSYFSEPNLPFARYSHAPAWLWALSWSQFYAPAISASLAVLLSLPRGPLHSPGANAA